MCANYKTRTVARCRQYYSAACLAVFLFLGLPSAYAQSNSLCDLSALCVAGS